MRRGLAMIALVAGQAMAVAPITTDPVPAGFPQITQCGLYKDNVLVGTFPLVNNACWFDIESQAKGSAAVYHAAFVVPPSGPFAKEEGPKSNPLPVTRPSPVTSVPVWRSPAVTAGSSTIVR